jgi:hypothetical protein
MAYLHDDDKPKDQADNAAHDGGLLGGYLSNGPQFGAAQPVLAGAPSLYGTGGSGPSVTGHVNFDRIYAANEGTAQRDARNMGNAAAGSAEAARGQLGDFKSRFASQSAGGSGQAASEDDVARSKGGGTPFWTPQQQQASQQTTAAGAMARPAAGSTQLAHDTEANWVAGQKAQAGHQYTGPDSLQDMGGFSGLLDSYGKAGQAISGLQDNAHIQGALDQQNKGPFIEGGNRLDAALIGQAGRPAFADISKRYSGLGGEVSAANRASIEQANASKAMALQNRQEHQGLLDNYMARQQPQADSAIHLAAAGQTLGPEAGSLGAQLGAGVGSLDDQNRIWADMGIDSDGEGHPKNAADARAMQGMTPADWRMLNDMTPAERKAWWEKRKSAHGG